MRQRVLAALMSVVVFCSVYSLVLPAITLDAATAGDMPGIEADQAAAEDAAGGSPEEIDAAYESGIWAGTAEEAANAGGSTDAGRSTDDAAGSDQAAEAGQAEVPVQTDQTDPGESLSVQNETAGLAPAVVSDTETETETETAPDTQEKYAQNPLRWHSEDFDVTLRFDNSVRLPEDTRLEVRILEEDEDIDKDDAALYRYYDERARKELADAQDDPDKGEKKAAQAETLVYYQIELYAEGEQIDLPSGNSDITISYSHWQDSPKYEKEKILAALFAADYEEKKASDADTPAARLLEKNKDQSKTAILEDDRLKKIQIKKVDLSDYDNVIGLLACPEKDAAETILTANGSDYTITVSYTAESGVPEGTRLQVKEIKSGSKAFDGYLEDAREAIADDEETMAETASEATMPAEYARFFDITLLHNGQEIKPESGVTVQISFPQPVSIDRLQEVNTIHFGDDGPAVIDNETAQSREGIENISFEADSFSVYGVVYTVDFHWEVNGKMYDFSLPGGGFVSFTDLVEVLGIANSDNNQENQGENPENGSENDVQLAGEVSGVDNQDTTALTLDGIEISEKTRKFVEGVEKVEFSSPELVWVGKVDSETTVGQLKDERKLDVEYSSELTEEQIDQINETRVSAGDWAVISLKAFDTEESLTVTMKNGDVFTIKVTDAQISTHVLTASGDTYKITVTYDDTAEIPDNAELRAREITEEDEGYQKLCDEADQALIEKYDTGLEDPILFDIGIYVDDKEIEPAEGSTVQVEIWLANDEEDESQVNPDAIADQKNDNSDPGVTLDNAGTTDKNDDYIELTDDIQGLWFNGKILNPDEEQKVPVIVHHKDDGSTDIIDELIVDLDENGETLSFDTDSFSGYSIGNTGLYLTDTLGNQTLYVGDEIYCLGKNINIKKGNGTVVERCERGNNGAGYTYYVFKLNQPGDFEIEYTYRNQTGWDYQGNPTYEDKKATAKGTVVDYKWQTSKPNQITNAVTNEEAGISLDIFEYDLDGVLNEAWNNGSTPQSNWYLNQYVNNGKNLKFWTACPGYDGYNNGWTGVGDHTFAPNIVSDKLSGGYPSVGGQSLDYLFDSTVINSDRRDHLGADGLFKYENGYYVYDSSVNYAWLNGDNKFEVYDTTYTYGNKDINQNTGTPIGFFPFHPYNEENEKTIERLSGHQQMNHHFGMSMSAKFAIPADGKDINGNPVTYEFSGDDDMWVYIDDDLTLDLGGIHQPVSGRIEFIPTNDGKIEVRVSTKDKGSDTWVPQQRSIKLTPNKEYTLRSFYIERGGGDSNCKIMFNLPTYRTLKLAKRLNGLSEKEYDKYKDEWFDFQLVVNGSIYHSPEGADQHAELRPIIKDGQGRILGKVGDDEFVPVTDAAGNLLPQYESLSNTQKENMLRWMVITEDKIQLKDGWTIEIPHLNRTDTFYAAEEDNVNMDEFERPHAEREFHNTADGKEREEEIDLIDSQTIDNEHIHDWKTDTYKLQETEKVTFTNTLKEKNLIVKKKWSDGNENHTDDSITFQVIAKIKQGENEGLYSELHADEHNIWGKVTGKLENGTKVAAKEEEILQHTYTLSSANDWEMMFEHLPAVTEDNEVITYSVVEKQGVAGYTSGDPTITAKNIVDVFKYFPDNSYPSETIGFYLKKDGKYYTGNGWSDTITGGAKEYTLKKSTIQDESYHCRFYDMPDGEYEVEPVEADDSNPLTKGLAIHTRPVKEFEILNEKKITISVKKEWDPVPDASENPSVTVELHRYAKKTSGVLSVTLMDNNGAAIQGAVFEVYKLNEETGEFTATGTTVTTDVNGIASVSSLTPGQYMLVQKTTPEGYSMDGNTTESGVLTVEDNKVTPQSLNTELTNTALVTAGQVTLTVTDSGAGSGTAGTAIQNAVFTLYKDGDVYSTGHTTDASGKITVGMLPAGTYYFEQTGFTAGSDAENAYKLPTGSDAKTTGFEIEEKPGQIQEKTQSLTNSLKGKGTVSLTVKSDIDNSPVSGAKFELYNGTEKVADGVTDDGGSLSFGSPEKLDAGSYTVKQVTTNSNLEVAADQNFTIYDNSYTNQDKSFDLINNEVSGNVTLEVWKAVATGTHSQSKIKTISNLKVNRTYYIRIGVTENNIKNGDKAGLCKNFVEGQKPSYETISNDSWTQSGDPRYYTISFTPTQKDTTYRYAIVSIEGWGFGENCSADLVDDKGNVISNLSSLSVQNTLSLPNRRTLYANGRGQTVSNSIIHVDASSASAPDGYTEDTTFTPISLTLSGGTWTGSFPAQDKTDANGDLYWYYVVETSHTPSDYWVDAYEGGVEGRLSETGTITIKNKKEVTEDTETPTSLTVKKRWLASDGTTDVSDKYADKTIKFDVYQIASTTTQAQSSDAAETQQMLIAIYDKNRTVKYLSDELGHLGSLSKYVALPVGAEVTATFTPKDPSVQATANYLDRITASGVQATRGNDGNVVTLKFTVDDSHSLAYLYNDNLNWSEFDVSVSIGTTTVSQPTRILSVELTKGTEEPYWTWTKSDLPGTKTEGDTTTVYKYYIKEVDNGNTDTVVSGLSEVPVTGGEIALKNVEKPTTPTPQTPKDPEPEIRKYVEKVSGQGSNDDYNLTLTVKSDSEVPSSKLDVLFVVDTTYSMTYKQLDGGQTSSWDGIKNAIDYLTKAFDGSDVDVQYAMTRFWSYQSNYSSSDQPYKDSEIVQQWTASSATLKNTLADLQLNHATNYDAAFYTLKNSGILTGADGREDTPKLVIFISDGYPNIYYDANGYDVADDRYVDGRYPDSENAAYARLSQVSGMNGFYALGVSNSVGQEVLDTLITYANAEHRGAFQCNDTQAIKNAFDSILNTYTGSSLKKVRIEDTLSDYAQPAGTGAVSNAAVTITVKNAEGNVVKTSTGTIAAPVTLVLDKTQRNGSDSAADRTLTATYDAATKKLKLQFPEGYELENHWDYQVTMAIEPTLKAYEEYRENGTYPHTGSKDTDVVVNTEVTSSNKAGFKSNSEAKLYYNDKTKDYPDPVIQTLLTEIQLLKVDGSTEQPLEDAKFTLYRKAEADDSKPVNNGGTGLTVKSITVPAGTSTQTVQVVEVKTDQLTDANGHITFDKLVPGTYYLAEVEAPTDYTGIETLGFTITVGDYDKDHPADWKLLIPTSGSYKGCTWEWDNTAKKYVLTVPNTKSYGYELPSTGGSGTAALYLIGSMLIAMAGVGLVMRRKRVR